MKRRAGARGSDNRWASAGGCLGVIGFAAALALGVELRGAAPAQASVDDELEFLPGSLARLGSRDAAASAAAPAAAPPSAAIASPTSEPSTAVATPPSEPGAAQPPTTAPASAASATATRPATPSPRGAPSGARGGPASPPAGGSRGLPSIGPSAGDPFGDPDGWDELTTRGDPWAKAVLAALREMQVQGFAADLGEGDVRFQISVCRDGSIDAVTRKGGTASADAQAAVVAALGRVELPPVPRDLAAHMRSDCAKLRYTFVWSAGVTR